MADGVRRGRDRFAGPDRRRRATRAAVALAGPSTQRRAPRPAVDPGASPQQHTFHTRQPKEACHARPTDRTATHRHAMPVPRPAGAAERSSGARGAMNFYLGTHETSWLSKLDV